MPLEMWLEIQATQNSHVANPGCSKISPLFNIILLHVTISPSLLVFLLYLYSIPLKYAFAFITFMLKDVYTVIEKDSFVPFCHT